MLVHALLQSPQHALRAPGAALGSALSPRAKEVKVPLSSVEPKLKQRIKGMGKTRTGSLTFGRTRCRPLVPVNVHSMVDDGRSKIIASEGGWTALQLACHLKLADVVDALSKCPVTPSIRTAAGSVAGDDPSVTPASLGGAGAGLAVSSSSLTGPSSLISSAAGAASSKARGPKTALPYVFYGAPVVNAQMTSSRLSALMLAVLQGKIN